MDLDKILSIFKKKSFWITLLCILLSIVMLIVSDNASKKNTEHTREQKNIPVKLININKLNGDIATDSDGYLSFKFKTLPNTKLKIILEGKDTILTKKSDKKGYVSGDVLLTDEYPFDDLTVKFKFIKKGYLTTSKEKIVKNESDENKKLNSEISESSASSDSSDDMNDAIKDIVGSSSDFDDVEVSGSYVADPYNAVITVTSDKDVRVVMAAILGNMQKNAGDKLNNFDSIAISIKDSNGNYALKTDYNVSTIMNNSKVYDPFKVKSLANSWSEN